MKLSAAWRLLSYFLCLLLIGCTDRGTITWQNVPPFPDHKDFASHSYHEKYGHHTIKQTSYLVEAPYPFDGVYRHYRKVLSPAWVLCKPPANWHQTIMSNSTSHSITYYWVNYAKQEYIELSLAYDSEGQGHRIPTNDRQRVVLLQIRGNFLEDLKWLDLKCPEKG